MTGYIRKDTTNNIADGNVINAADLDNEFDGVQAAFSATTGHTHDGTASEGAPITKIGPVQDVIVSIAAMYPKVTNTIDLGTSSLKYKDAFFSGSVTSSSLTSGRVLYAGASGLIQDDADLTFNGTTLTAGNDIAVNGLTVGRGTGAISTNTAAGKDALLVNTTGSGNTALGYFNLKANTTGINNTALGYASLFTNISGSYNTAVGATSLGLTTGSFNTAIGRSSGSSISTGSKNSILGNYSGYEAPISQTGSNYVVLSDGDGNVRAYWDGANPTFPGVITLSDGTANGVPYLDGSKVLTSGAALTFDGTILSSTRFAGALNGTVGATTPSSGAFTSLSASQGLTPRVVSTASATSITFNVATTDLATMANTEAAGTFTINAPTGTPVNGQKLMFRLQSTNVQTFSWNAAFTGSTDLGLPNASTGSSKYDYMGFVYNATSSTWQLIGKVFGF